MLLLTGPSWAAFDFEAPADSSSERSSSSNHFTVNGRPLFLHRQGVSLPAMDSTLVHTTRTAESVWDCAVVLAKFLEHQDQQRRLREEQQQQQSDRMPFAAPSLRGLRVCELGAGRGLAGMSAAVLGAQTTLTDVDAAVPALAEIVRINGLQAGQLELAPGSSGAVEAVVALDWTNRQAALSSGPLALPFDLIIAADVVWVHELIEPLVETIADLVQGTTMCLLAYQSRSSRADVALFGALAKAGLAVQAIDTDDCHPIYRRDAITIYSIRRK